MRKDMEVNKESMGKKSVEKRVCGAKQEPEFPMKPGKDFLALREWLDENHDRDVFQIVEDDRKLIYGKVREKALGGNMEALKTIFNKTFPDMKIERKEERLDARQLIQLYVHLCGDKKAETNVQDEDEREETSEEK